jgi:3-oxoacyl-[acyl-carrier-protein] synthase III
VHPDPATFPALVVDAGREVIEASGLDRRQITSVLVYSGLSTWWSSQRRSRAELALFRYPVARIARELGLSHANVVGISQQGCTGLLTSVDLAASLLDRARDGAVLCLTGDVLPSRSRREIMYNLMSDAAAAVLLTPDAGRNRLVRFHQLAEAAYWDTPRHEDELVAAYFPMAKLEIEEALAAARLSIADIRWFVPANVSVRSWTILADLLKIPPERGFVDNVARLGHTVSCDHVINLVDMERRGLLSRGDRLLLFTFGFGASWSSLIVEH